MKDGTGRKAGLEPAFFTVKKLSIFQIPRFSMSALGASKAAFPSLFEKVLLTRLIVRKCFLKFYQIVLFIFLGHSVTWLKNMPENGLGVKCIGIKLIIRRKTM
jgi:hypothetical protein